MSIRKPSLLVVGGGTAGWMTAALLQHHLAPAGFTITLVESPDVGIIGVGEGSTPQLRNFFNLLGIAESAWMPACDATFKNGIRFNQWIAKPQSTYFHPFPSLTDKFTAGAFLLNCHQRQNGITSYTQPDDFFLAAYLSAQGMSPKSTDPKRAPAINYAYHFDAIKVGQFIRQHCVNAGVQHITAHVDSCRKFPNGSIQSVILADGDELSADWFFDCTGFRGLLIQETLKTPFISFKDNLFNDRAVAIGSQRCTQLLPQTTATALTHGWAWRIPLTTRTGNGYVYSSDFCAPETAEQELRQHLGLLDGEVDVRHLTMRVGRCTNTWVNNCIAVGLSQGFIEPLEATALHIVQETVENFISAFSAGDYGAQHREQYNQVINARIDGIRDYIVCHYQASNRADSDYWQANTHNTQRSDSLNAILDVWFQGGDLTAEINRQQIAHYYPAVSWHCLLAGYDCFKSNQHAVPNAKDEAVFQRIAELGRAFLPHQSSVMET
ncbi:tryptophan halogenase family protein [Alteromonas flava]|uniref:tryptophan halogenase family protein n=1 Tax=Alteromonas flava TaxID=2048003 RepID=UPI000F5E3B4D|nr:tryptophan halogenase family protein [Alteromonas flava]